MTLCNTTHPPLRHSTNYTNPKPTILQSFAANDEGSAAQGTPEDETPLEKLCRLHLCCIAKENYCTVVTRYHRPHKTDKEQSHPHKFVMSSLMPAEHAPTPCSACAYSVYLVAKTKTKKDNQSKERQNPAVPVPKRNRAEKTSNIASSASNPRPSAVPYPPPLHI